MTNSINKKSVQTNSIIIPDTPAIMFNEKEFNKTLIVSDLHIGYVYGKNKKGIILPESKRPEEDIIQLLDETQPDTLIFLGDFKDEIFGTSHPIAGRIWKFLKQLLEKTAVIIIKGNHDGKIEEVIPEEIKLIQADGLRLTQKETNKSIGLWHGHASPALDVWTADITISAHAHPAYTFRDEIGSKITQKVWVKAKWLNTKEGEPDRMHIIVPPFNRYIDGYSVDSEYFKTIVLMRDAIDFDNAEIFTLDGVLIGTLKNLREDRRELEKKLSILRKEVNASKKKRKY
ncbi:MAG: metallophosphoesterase [Candidatus Heimdallarchaeota archaeon]